jgi:UDPglucose 6-dehydrogenase
MRDSPSLAIVPALVGKGAIVKVFDPQGMKEAKHLPEFAGVVWCNSAYEAATDADVLAIVTEWNEFRALDLERIKGRMKQPILVDLRNIYRPDDVARAGFHYTGIGRGHLGPNAT